MRIRCVSLTLCVIFLAAGSVQADDQAEMKALIDKAIKARGGEAKLAKFKAETFTFKGKIHFDGNGIDITGEAAFQVPTRSRIQIEGTIDGNKFKMIQVVDGDKGWVHNEGKTEAMDKDTLVEEKESLHAGLVDRLISLKDKSLQLSPLGEAKVGDRTAVGVRVSHKGRRDINLFFDKEKGFLLKRERQGKDFMMGGKEFSEELFYSDYKEVEGVQIAMKLVMKRDGKDYVAAELTEVTLAEKLEDNLFAKP